MAVRRSALSVACLCLLWAALRAQVAPEPRFNDCPVDLFFVLDTSESVALRVKPPDFYINQIKTFTKTFIDNLVEIRQPCDRRVTWNSGALHYSDDIEMVRELGDMTAVAGRNALKKEIDNIRYIGKGTYTDCAIKRGIAELMIGGSYYHENKYIVVVTDGHPVTGYKEPCGGIQDATNEARQHGIKVFAVAISPDQEDTRLSIIATDKTYRQNFTAADNARTSPLQTIRTIIDIMTNETKDVCCSFDCTTSLIKKKYPMFLKYLIYFIISNCLLQGLQGEPGPKGDPGPYGNKGEKGQPGAALEVVEWEAGEIDRMRGVPGRQGSPGYRGDEGQAGPEGSKGPRGIKGSPGDRGVMGERGEDGAAGNGTAGCPGFQGYPGPRGDPGEPGTRGTPGPKGDDGEPGDSGPDVSHRKMNAFGCTVVCLNLIKLCLECTCGPMDLAFVVDSSESIGANNFAIAKDVIIAIIDRLVRDQQMKFGVNDSRIGVVQYSGPNAQEVVKLGDPNIRTLTDLKQAVKELRWLAEATYTGEALQFSLKNLIGRFRKEDPVVIVLTDGRSDIVRDKEPLDVLCNQGIRVGGIGVKDYSGRMPNPEQLGQLVCASDVSKPGFSLVRDNFAELLEDDFLQNLTAQICQGIIRSAPITNAQVISFDTQTDIAILMDSSASVGSKNYEITKKFVKRLAERFITADTQATRAAQVRVAVGQYSRDANLNTFTSNLTQIMTNVNNAVFQNTGTDIMAALNYAIERLRGSGTRVKKLLVFWDGRSQGITRSVIEKRARDAEAAGIKLYVLATGTQVNEANLRDLVSRGRPFDVAFAQRHLLRASDYASLLRGVFYQTVSRKISLKD
uniref:VWFA domain-containing protein n=1 Tax=Denticeps clupeoides TaxID=299321 RepID=A0AAY4BYJ8_9TELE